MCAKFDPLPSRKVTQDLRCISSDAKHFLVSRVADSANGGTALGTLHYLGLCKLLCALYNFLTPASLAAKLLSFCDRFDPGDRSTSGLTVFTPA